MAFGSTATGLVTPFTVVAPENVLMRAEQVFRTAGQHRYRRNVRFQQRLHHGPDAGVRLGIQKKRRPFSGRTLARRQEQLLDPRPLRGVYRPVIRKVTPDAR